MYIMLQKSDLSYLSPLSRKKCSPNGLRTLFLLEMFRLLNRRLSRLIGQPTNFSHPELMAPDHVTPLISKSELHQRRRVLMNKIINFKNENPSLEPLAEMHGKERMEHVLILTGASKQKKSNDINFELHQHSNFNYLTGFIEEDAILLLETIPNKPHPQYKSVLFVQPYSEQGSVFTSF